MSKDCTISVLHIPFWACSCFTYPNPDNPDPEPFYISQSRQSRLRAVLHIPFWAEAVLQIPFWTQSSFTYSMLGPEPFYMSHSGTGAVLDIPIPAIQTQSRFAYPILSLEPFYISHSGPGAVLHILFCMDHGDILHIPCLL